MTCSTSIKQLYFTMLSITITLKIRQPLNSDSQLDTKTQKSKNLPMFCINWAKKWQKFKNFI